MVKDPVCKMMVDERVISISLKLEDTYSASSVICKSQFNKDPIKYGYRYRALLIFSNKGITLIA
jgi:YHS domain-containing protein